MSYIGSLEVRGESIGKSFHEGHEGWTFRPLREPGMGHEKLMEVLSQVRLDGMADRTKEIGRLLGVASK